MDRTFDIYERLPEEMAEYLSHRGFNFSKKMCEWAVSLMRDRNGAKIPAYTKEKFDEMMKRYNITLENDNGYNGVYVLNMCRADYFGSSITTDQQMAQFVKDYIDDKDGIPDKALRHFAMDCAAKGIVINWADLM